MEAGAIRFFSGKTWAAWVYPDRIVTVLEDGASTTGVAPDTEEFRGSAEFLGYGSDIYWHMIEHDLLHMMVADALGVRSPSMWYQAHNPDAPAWTGPMPPAGQLEEDRLVAIQRLLNVRDIPQDNSWAVRGFANLYTRFGGPGLYGLVEGWRDRLRTPEPMTTEWANSPAYARKVIR